MGVVLTVGMLTAGMLTAGMLTGCSDASADRAITVSVPPSLQAVMATIAIDFETAHPGTHVTIAGAGARLADVIATGDEASMERLGNAVISPRRFASNSLIIVVPPGNPAHLTGVDSLTSSELRVAVCAARLACGAPVIRIESVTGVQLADPVHVDSGEKAVADVASGRVDAALAYRTQTRPVRGVSVDTVDDPVFSTVVNRYPIGVARGSRSDALAAEFIATVIGPVGGRALATAGFGPPSG